MAKFRLDTSRPAHLSAATKARLEAMTDDAVDIAARNDGDTPEASSEMLKVAQVSRYVRQLREGRGMTQAEFSHAYAIPVATLRDWEQGRRKPEAPAMALLKVIEQAPEVVRVALAG